MDKPLAVTMLLCALGLATAAYASLREIPAPATAAALSPNTLRADPAYGNRPLKEAMAR